MRSRAMACEIKLGSRRRARPISNTSMSMMKAPATPATTHQKMKLVLRPFTTGDAGDATTGSTAGGTVGDTTAAFVARVSTVTVVATVAAGATLVIGFNGAEGLATSVLVSLVITLVTAFVITGADGADTIFVGATRFGDASGAVVEVVKDAT